MVFFTRFWRRRRRCAAPGRWLPRLAAAVGLALALAVPAHAEGVLAQGAELEAGEDGYLLHAGFSVRLTATLEEALLKGVSLYFVTDFELLRPRWYWFDERIAEGQFQSKLGYNALTRQYRLSAGPLYQNFDSLEAALAVLGRVRNRPVADRDALRKGAEYHAAVRMRLDVSQLPKPLQVSAITSREWSIESDWFRWKIGP
ncbi:MAG: DUF4390 domain-containing protein [Betaproteobacteria bacterium]|nr:DUF4390 domain-containing protein [Betaproteobacteria bacterium]